MGVVTLVVVVVVAACLLIIGIRSACLPRLLAWILSDREEKAALTRLKGHYNANGYLVSSESELRLSGTGSFKRFESVDCEIPPQPLRPAPTQVTEETAPVGGGLQRAVSCESVCSDNSVGAGELVASHIAGYLCVAIDYDMDGSELAVTVLEAKDLYCRELAGSQPHPLLDTYVSLYLMPEKAAICQTKTYRGSNSPSYKERFSFHVEGSRFTRSAVVVHVYSAGREANRLVGEAVLPLADVPTRQPITTWLTLADSLHEEGSLGEVLFSLSYLPTAERLTVVIVKARNLKLSSDTAEPFVKVYLLRGGKKVYKKKTSAKKGDPSPIYNEAMIFPIPNHHLQLVQIRVSVVEAASGGKEEHTLGHVIIGNMADGKALSHWSQMMLSLRKPVAMWHPVLAKSHERKQ